MNKFRARLAALVLAITLGCLLVACGDTPTSTSVPAATTAASTTSVATTTAAQTTAATTSIVTTTAAQTTAATTSVATTAVPTTAPAATPAATTAAISPTAATTAAVQATAATATKTNLTSGCATSYDASTDYFPDKAALKYTSNFKIEYFKNYKVITVTNPWRDAKETFQYVLVQCGTSAPKGYDKALTIEVPIKSIVAMSTTYLPHLDKLGVLDKLVGVDNFDYISTPAVRKMIDDKKLVAIGSGAKVNIEQTINLKPDLIMTYGTGSPDSDAHPKLLEAGLKVALNSEYMDTTPLGRSEWVKFTAAFFNKEAEAEKLFGGIATRYEDLAKKAKASPTKPTVFGGSPYKGTWYIAGGDSYVAKAYADAGANYLWADDKSTGSLSLTFETVFDRASNADFWISPGSYNSLDALKAADERLANFAAFKNGKVYNNTAKVNEKGGNDIYESGVLNPDLVLADFIKIFHPELVPDYQFTFHLKLEPKK